MRTFLQLFILAISFAIISCSQKKDENRPVSTFVSPFPKKNINLSKILGEQLIIKNEWDTLIFNITSNKKNNLITNTETGDTAFLGTVSKFRGLYYFTQQLNDSSYWIHAVKISDNLIYGLKGAWTQTLFVDQAIKKGTNKKLVKYINSDNTVIRLYTYKGELKKLFSNIIEYYSPDTILNYEGTFPKIQDTTSIVAAIDPEDFNYILKAYPNPTTDIINIELQQKSKSTFQLTDLNGKTIIEGQLNEIINKIDLSKQPTGIYALTIMNLADKQNERIKIVKTE
jgi:hypothetical protein